MHETLGLQQKAAPGIETAVQALNGLQANISRELLGLDSDDFWGGTRGKGTVWF